MQNFSFFNNSSSICSGESSWTLSKQSMILNFIFSHGLLPDPLQFGESMKWFAILHWWVLFLTQDLIILQAWFPLGGWTNSLNLALFASREIDDIWCVAAHFLLDHVLATSCLTLELCTLLGKGVTWVAPRFFTSGVLPDSLLIHTVRISSCNQLFKISLSLLLDKSLIVLNLFVNLLK